MTRGWLIALVVLVVAVGGGAWFAQHKGKSTGKLAPLPEKTPLEVEADKIRVAIEGRDREVASLQKTDAGWLVHIGAKAENPELEKIQKDAADVFEAVKGTKAPLAELALNVRTNALKDVYGNTLKDLPIAEIVLLGSTIEKVDWKGFDPKNFERIADRYWIHEEILRLHEEKKQGKQSGGGGSGSSGGAGGGSSGSSSSSGGQ